MNEPVRLRYAGTCHLCATPIPAGSYGLWQRAAKTATCMACVDALDTAQPEAEVVSAGPTADPVVPPPTIRLRYAATCATCATAMGPGTEATWDRAAKRAAHPACPDPEPEPLVEATVAAVPLDVGVAGGSARKIADRQQATRERLKQRQDDATRQAHPVIGRLLVRARDLLAEPEEPTSWQKGAAGEEAVGRTFEPLTVEGFVVLHDRRKPGTRSNIDHIVVGPQGVYVIDAKHCTGRLEIRSTGTRLRPAPNRLYINGRSQDKRVAAMDWQVAWVRDASGDPIDTCAGIIRPVLCFLGVEVERGQRPSLVGGNDVLVTWPRRFVEDVGRDGPLSRGHIEDIAQRIADALPPAVAART